MGVELGADGWGNYEYDDVLEKRPEEEEEWYIISYHYKEALFYFYQELGFNFEIIVNNLKGLSKAESVSVNAEKYGTFKNASPILFSCLDATFGLMPSNSQISKQTHGQI